MQPSSSEGSSSQPPETTSPTTPSPRPGGRRTLLIALVGIIVVIVIIAASVVYLGLLNPASSAGTIKLGFTISLTGTYATEGNNSLNGIKTATQWINSNGGITVGGKSYQLVLDYKDDQSVSGNIVPLYTGIITNDNAQFLLAPYSSGLTSAAAPIADNYNLVMLSHGGAADTIWSSATRKNLVEVLSPASGYLKGAIDYIKANHPTDKIAAIYASDSFSSLATQSAIAYANNQGLMVVYNQSYPTTVTDLSTQLAAAKAAGANDLIGGGHFTDGLLIMNQLPGASWTPSFISLLVAVTETSFHTQLGAAANNVTGPSQWETQVAYTPAMATAAGFSWFGPSTSDFTSLYSTVTGGATPTYHSGEAAAAVLDLAYAIEQANSLNTTAVRAELGTMKLMTFFGEFQISSAGLQIAHSMVLDQWQAGALKVVWPTSIATSMPEYPYTGS